MIEGLPLGFNTKIGQEGQGISQGQRQRILITRAVYKKTIGKKRRFYCPH